jgi:hypothetical protein
VGGRVAACAISRAPLPLLCSWGQAKHTTALPQPYYGRVVGWILCLVVLLSFLDTHIIYPARLNPPPPCFTIHAHTQASSLVANVLGTSAAQQQLVPALMCTA